MKKHRYGTKPTEVLFRRDTIIIYQAIVKSQ